MVSFRTSCGASWMALALALTSRYRLVASAMRPTMVPATLRAGRKAAMGVWVLDGVLAERWSSAAQAGGVSGGVEERPGQAHRHGWVDGGMAWWVGGVAVVAGRRHTPANRGGWCVWMG